jgi:hypothetical protein
MSDIKLKTPLNANGPNYLSWNYQMQTLLGAKELLELLELETKNVNNQVEKPAPNKGKMFQILAIINQYITEPLSLQLQYIRCPIQLWKTLEKKFGDKKLQIQYAQKPFKSGIVDHKTANEFNVKLWDIVVRLKHYGANELVTDAALIEKTLFTTVSFTASGELYPHGI